MVPRRPWPAWNCKLLRPKYDQPVFVWDGNPGFEKKHETRILIRNISESEMG